MCGVVVAYPGFTESRLMVGVLEFFFANRQNGLTLIVPVLDLIMIIFHIQYSMDA